jgi:hypothetical protein
MERSSYIITIFISMYIATCIIQDQENTIKKLQWSNDTLVLDYKAERGMNLECQKRLIKM